MPQLQPMPVAAVGVRPAGTVSLTVTVPDVAPAPELVTVIAYVAPVWPCVKLPECVLLIVRSATTALIVVMSLLLSLAVLVSPPPDTVAVLVTLLGALPATFTVSVIAG